MILINDYILNGDTDCNELIDKLNLHSDRKNTITYQWHYENNCEKAIIMDFNYALGRYLHKYNITKYTKILYVPYFVCTSLYDCIDFDKIITLDCLDKQLNSYPTIINSDISEILFRGVFREIEAEYDIDENSMQFITISQEQSDHYQYLELPTNESKDYFVIQNEINDDNFFEFVRGVYDSLLNSEHFFIYASHIQLDKHNLKLLCNNKYITHIYTTNSNPILETSDKIAVLEL